MTRLSVNLNKVALLRNQRTIGIPSVTKAAEIATAAGAYGITVHPRPDERHIRTSDVYELSDMLVEVEFNIEGNPFTGQYMQLMRDIRPDQATLVPDSPDAVTSDHGWDLKRDGLLLQPVINALKRLDIRVSLFMDPVEEGIKLAKELGADRIELYTEPYATAFRTDKNLSKTLFRFVEAGRFARSLGLGLNAGHDLNLQNLGRFVSSVPGVLEVSIGHALIADALETGLAQAVKAYVSILEKN
ncbi:MAG TPA: pyridoxine 5'-phosphate synthase [Sedimentisphaerales bacterium]|nr:pyridoxine 5'-phosphate synthase [Sedimentisphaerales bacterium]